MSAINLATKTIVLGALGVQTVYCTGQYFVCIASSAPFVMSIDGGQELDMVAGIGFPTSTKFTSIIFRDKSGAGCSITFFTGSQGVNYQSPSFAVISKNSPTYSLGAPPIVAMAAGSKVDFLGLNGANVRKQILVTNNDAALIVQVLGSDGDVIGLVYPQRPWTLEVGGLVSVKNANGGPLGGTVYVGETFYS